MSSCVNKIVVTITSIILLAVGAAVLLLARTGSSQTLTINLNPQPPGPGKLRNLSLQPEAFRMSRRLGKRFLTSSESSSSIVGSLTTGGVERAINITRRQTATGEDVTMGMPGEPATLAWNDVDGAIAIGSSLNETQQTLIERVGLDNPDHFVLAQLRGATYYTIAHNVRDDAGGSENYDGPLWDVVRVDEPQTQGAQRLMSNSRLYYINVQTGLIDKIVSELKGETIAANILEWSDQSGNKFPSHIVWKRGNETVQEFRLTSVSIQPQQ